MSDDQKCSGYTSDLEAAIAALAPAGTTFSPDQLAEYTAAAETAISAYIYGYPLLLMQATQTAFIVVNKVRMNTFLTFSSFRHLTIHWWFGRMSTRFIRLPF